MAVLQCAADRQAVQVVFIDNITPYLGLEAFNTSSQGKSKYRRRLNALRALVVCLFQVDLVSSSTCTADVLRISARV